MTQETKDIFETPTPQVLTLADGKEYELPVMNLNVMANAEAYLGYGLNKLGDKIDEEPATALRAVIFALLKEKDKKLTLEKVGDLITLEVMSDVSDVLTKIMM